MDDECTMAPAAGVVDVEVVPKFAGRLFKARSPWAFNPGCSLMLSPSDWPPHTYIMKPTKLHPYGHNLLVRELSFMQALVQGAHKRQALKDSQLRTKPGKLRDFSPNGKPVMSR